MSFLHFAHNPGAAPGGTKPFPGGQVAAQPGGVNCSPLLSICATSTHGTFLWSPPRRCIKLCSLCVKKWSIQTGLPRAARLDGPSKESKRRCTNKESQRRCTQHSSSTSGSIAALKWALCPLFSAVGLRAVLGDVVWVRGWVGFGDRGGSEWFWSTILCCTPFPSPLMSSQQRAGRKAEVVRVSIAVTQSISSPRSWGCGQVVKHCQL